MRTPAGRRRVLAGVIGAWGAAALVAACAGGGAVPAARAAVRAAGSWGKAIEVPGLGALNKGGYAEVNSVSCGAAGNCAAGGVYTDRRRHGHGFVAVERRGRWTRAIEVPGLRALSKGYARVSSVSCSSAGNCAAGGIYADRRGGQGFVTAERRGRWIKAIKVPGLEALNKGGSAEIGSVSCASPGNCAAGGDYRDRSGHQQGFVVSQRHGRWGRAVEVPGLGTLNKGGSAAVGSVSCASAGSCAAAGGYMDGNGSGQGFVAVEKNGVWGRAAGVPGLRALNKEGDAAVSSVSCASAGSCAAGGYYTDGNGSRGFVVSEKNGVWGRAISRLGPLNYANAAVSSVSCASAGNCVAGASYGEPYGSKFVVSEKNGVWGRAINVPGLGALDKGRSFSGGVLVSCYAPGNCAAGGGYADSRENLLGFVLSRRNGRWGRAIKMPGLGALTKGGGLGVIVNEVSCAPAGSCAAGGLYTDRRHHPQGFVVSRTR